MIKAALFFFRQCAPALFVMGFALMLAACGGGAVEAEHHDEHGEDERESGPHGGRLLEDGDFALEVVIVEGVGEPRIRLYPYRDGKPLAPEDVDAEVTLSRLGGGTERFRFEPQEDFLAGSDIVREPHSFDIEVAASADGENYQWSYESYEGRTEIPDAAAKEAGVVIEQAGPATIAETLDVLGRVDFAPGAEAILRGRFPGQVLEVAKTVGDAVKEGEVIARIESNESLRTYDVRSPIDGVIVERRTNPGDVAREVPLFVVGDVTRLIADFHVFASDLERVKPGQAVTVRTVEGGAFARSVIQNFLPTRETATQTIIARVPLANDDGAWLPGMTVRGDIVVDRTEAPLAVRTGALQRFRDFTVVFEKVGETYEARPLKIGRRNGEWAQVLAGIEPGAAYVSKNSFLIKADIEKSGAAHAH